MKFSTKIFSMTDSIINGEKKNLIMEVKKVRLTSYLLFLHTIFIAWISFTKNSDKYENFSEEECDNSYSSNEEEFSSNNLNSKVSSVIEKINRDMFTIKETHDNAENTIIEKF